MQGGYVIRNREIRNRLIVLAVVVLICFLLSRYVVQIMLIQGTSMEPAYHSGQFVLLNKWDRQYEAGDVIAFRCAALDVVLVKRVADIDIASGAESNLYYVLGDNLEMSIDSRSEQVGLVKEKDIIGKIWLPRR